MSYSRLIDGLHKAEVDVDRKVLADLAVRDPQAFSAIVRVAAARLAEDEPVTEAAS
jgi:large subunit ribosomal protein L20